MEESSKQQVRKQLKQTSNAIDLIKMSQRSQHTSIKEALRKMLKCISMMAETGVGEVEVKINKDPLNGAKKDLIKQAEKIAERSKTNETNKTKS